MTRPSLANVYIIDIVGVVLASTYAWFDRPAPHVVGTFIELAPILAVGSWLRLYLRYAQVALPFDFGFFYVIAWPILVPIYARRIYPERPWRRIGHLFALALAPTLAASVVGIVIAIRRSA